MLPSEVFDKAVALIEERGWCQGIMRDEGGELCADGALWFAALEFAPGAPDYDAVRMASWNLLQLRTEMQFGGLVEYNDHPGRTKDEVLEMLRWMAEQTRAEGR